MQTNTTTTTLTATTTLTTTTTAVPVAPPLPGARNRGGNSSIQTSPRVIERAGGVDLFFMLPLELRTNLLRRQLTGDDLVMIGKKIQFCVRLFTLTCHAGKNVFNPGHLNDMEKLGLARYRGQRLKIAQVPNGASWRTVQFDLRRRRQLIENSLVIDLQSLAPEIMLSVLKRTYSPFPFRTLKVGDRHFPGKYFSMKPQEWEELVHFLSRHASSADRPSVELHLDISCGAPLGKVAEALAVYAKDKNGRDACKNKCVLDIALAAESESAAKEFEVAAPTGVLRTLELFSNGDNSKEEDLAAFNKALSACTSLQTLAIYAPSCNQLPALLECAAGNKALQVLELGLYKGDLQHLQDLPKLLEQFPDLKLLNLNLPPKSNAKGQKLIDTIQTQLPQLLVVSKAAYQLLM